MTELGKPEFGWERGGVRGFGSLDSSVTPSPDFLTSFGSRPLPCGERWRCGTLRILSQGFCPAPRTALVPFQQPNHTRPASYPPRRPIPSFRPPPPPSPP